MYDDSEVSAGTIKTRDGVTKRGNRTSNVILSDSEESNEGKILRINPQDDTKTNTQRQKGKRE